MEKTHLSARSGTSKMDSNSQNHPKVAIYSRVSTEEQAKEGLSVEAQIDKCKSFCNARDWEVFKVYKDAGYSAGSLNRPALELLLRDADENKFNIILVYKIDRFSRKLKDLIMVLDDLKSKDINFTSVTEQIDTTSAMGEAFFQIIGVFAQLERGMVKERVELAFDRKIQFGEALFRAPLGYTYANKKLVLDPTNAQKIIEIFEMWAQNISYKEICEKFNISTSTFYQIVKNPVYIGKIQYRGKLYDGKHKPIIDSELFYQVNPPDKTSKEE
ncbi:MAG TPA: recombinase family protein [Nanoarchaeota archaeon]|nr:recombinase family protein [Nanoarchaeota archaeon]HIH63815.1 recombinase family protein [Nanoarchaeota archaeon]HIJ09120.1 recombinase family protein [Nanoarchaeota archaeon]